MRGLTVKQKRLLDAWYEENKKDVWVGFDLGRCDNFPLSLLRQLEQINDSEILYPEINRYLQDKAMNEGR